MACLRNVRGEGPAFDRQVERRHARNPRAMKEDHGRLARWCALSLAANLPDEDGDAGLGSDSEVLASHRCMARLRHCKKDQRGGGDEADRTFAEIRELGAGRGLDERLVLFPLLDH
jgi:hypothetical protein